MSTALVPLSFVRTCEAAWAQAFFPGSAARRGLVLDEAAICWHAPVAMAALRRWHAVLWERRENTPAMT